MKRDVGNFEEDVSRTLLFGRLELMHLVLVESIDLIHSRILILQRYSPPSRVSTWHRYRNSTHRVLSICVSLSVVYPSAQYITRFTLYHELDLIQEGNRCVSVCSMA